MANEIEVTVTDSDALAVTVEGDTQITVENTELKEGYIRETFTGYTGANVLLTLGNTFRANSLVVYLNGILMEKDVDYTEGANRDRITVLYTLVASDKIECRYTIN